MLNSRRLLKLCSVQWANPCRIRLYASSRWYCKTDSHLHQIKNHLNYVKIFSQISKLILTILNLFLVSRDFLNNLQNFSHFFRWGLTLFRLNCFLCSLNILSLVVKNFSWLGDLFVSNSLVNWVIFAGKLDRYNFPFLSSDNFTIYFQEIRCYTKSIVNQTFICQLWAQRSDKI